MKNLSSFKKILPAFPRTQHAPIEPNAQRDDLIASEECFRGALASGEITVEEKVDAANCGMTIVDGYPIIRNRNHILNKSYSGKTPAKMQFSSIWNWFYANQDKFYSLERELGFMPCVYGEWMFAVHSIEYTDLPDLFIPFDLYNPKTKSFISPKIYRELFNKVGFFQVPLAGEGNLCDNDLLKLRDRKSAFSNNIGEGIYIKICNNEVITHRFKMVRPGFIQGENWNKLVLKKNIVRKANG